LVLLISLKAGGVGLNLVAASRVFMLDPWWSFAVEAQAIDRVSHTEMSSDLQIHRVGQNKSVVITRFIVKDSVEEKMLKIQDRKVRQIQMAINLEFRGKFTGYEQGGKASCYSRRYQDTI
jgi:SNF2 family DNA or RNA helicase